MACAFGVAREVDKENEKYRPWDFFIPMAFFV
jgi:hypothetical protein